MSIISKESCIKHIERLHFVPSSSSLYFECAILTVTLSFLLLFYPRAILPLLSDITLKDGNKQPPALAPSESPAEMPVPVHAKGSSPADWTGVGKRT